MSGLRASVVLPAAAALAALVGTAGGVLAVDRTAAARTLEAHPPTTTTVTSTMTTTQPHWLSPAEQWTLPTNSTVTSTATSTQPYWLSPGEKWILWWLLFTPVGALPPTGGDDMSVENQYSHAPGSGVGIETSSGTEGT